MAGRHDRSPRLGPPDHRTSLNVLNIRELHLAALQAHGGPEAQRRTPKVKEDDVQLLEAGDTFEDPHEEDGP